MDMDMDKYARAANKESKSTRKSMKERSLRTYPNGLKTVSSSKRLHKRSAMSLSFMPMIIRVFTCILVALLCCKASCQVAQSKLCPFSCQDHPSPVFRLRGGTMSMKNSESSISNDQTRSSDSNFNPSMSGEGRSSSVFEKMKLSELHRALKERGLNTRGNKADLVERLVEYENKQEGKDLFSSQELRSRNAALFSDNIVARHKLPRTEEINSPTRAVDSSSSISVPSPHKERGMKVLEKVRDVNHADYVFEVFATQAEAFKFADARPSLGLQVYAQDKKNTGAKQYVAATYRVGGMEGRAAEQGWGLTWLAGLLATIQEDGPLRAALRRDHPRRIAMPPLL
eukprot:753542-Hanusia_phi.AAC.2